MEVGGRQLRGDHRRRRRRRRRAGHRDGRLRRRKSRAGGSPDFGTQKTEEILALILRKVTALLCKLDYYAAVLACNEAFRLTPSPPAKIWSLRAAAFLGLRDYGSCAADCKAALELDPGSLPAKFWYASALHGKGEWLASIAKASEVLKACPSHSQSLALRCDSRREPWGVEGAPPRHWDLRQVRAAERQGLVRQGRGSHAPGEACIG